MFGICFVMSTLYRYSFAIVLMRNSLTVFLLSCDSQCSVALHHGAVGWIAYVKDVTPCVGQFLAPWRHNLNKLGRGPLGNATYQISMI